MDGSSKEALIEEAPPVRSTQRPAGWGGGTGLSAGSPRCPPLPGVPPQEYTASPRLPCLLGCHHLKCLLIVVVVVVLLVVVIAGALLMWLRAEQGRADAVLRTGAGRAWEEDAATFYVDGGAGPAATVVYDYKNLLVSYRSRLHRACYVTRMDKDNIPGLDAATQAFQRRQVSTGGEGRGFGGGLAMPLADRSLLGTTASILCSVVPVYWI
uniref:Surfactant protein C n=1 Tax=Anser brachyrhynchus TaxID=132585 RepID=A0A8B9BJK6_9AVES